MGKCNGRWWVLWVLLSLVVLLEVRRAEAGGGSGDGGGGDSPPPNLRAKKLILTKVYCLIVVFFATFFGGISPYFLRWNQAFLVLGTQFAGGVFLATAFIHFLSDAHNTFASLTTNPYSFAEMLAVAGYLLTMFADTIIQWVYSRSPAPSSARVDMEHCAKEVQENEEMQVLGRKTSLGDALLLVLALCFHSVFEGIAIGVAVSPYDAWRVLWTVSLHKVFAAIAMGIALLRILPDRPFISCAVYAFAFAISSPIGVAIGIIIDSSTQGNTADWIYAIAMGIATGVFVYVAVNHLLAKGYAATEKINVEAPIFKFLAVVLGAAVIAVVMIWD